ncbi:MAG: hypothetical protein WC645_02065 [Candidatus Margulisiibacteriota bacterium]
MKKIWLAIVLLIGIASLSFSEAVYYSTAELTKKADLVITGQVIKVAPTKEIRKLVSDLTGRVHCATIKVNKTIKGKNPGPEVIIEFVKLNPELEADVQDPQFAVGNKGTAYLVKLKNGRYKALGKWVRGWSK